MLAAEVRLRNALRTSWYRLSIDDTDDDHHEADGDEDAPRSLIASSRSLGVAQRTLRCRRRTEAGPSPFDARRPAVADEEARDEQEEPTR